MKDLVFNIPKGEVFGYIGPNGAGKTTTIRHLMGFLKPDSGSSTINNLDCWSASERIKENLGDIPGEIAFFDGMTGSSFLDFMAELNGLKKKDRRNSLIDRFELDPSGKIRKMSNGMKQKLCIVAACMHDPSIMIFDEPSSGLDPLMQDRFVKFIREEKERGKTILMSSHSFEEIDRTCDRAGIIRDGVLVDVREITYLKENQRRQFILTLNNPEDSAALKRTGLNILNESGANLEIEVKGSVDSFIKEIAKVSVENIEIKSATLEDVFMQYYGKEVQ